jgi:hypothetical protein
MNSIGVFSGDRVKDTRQEKIVCISLPHKFIPSYSRFRVVFDALSFELKGMERILKWSINHNIR